ncbi:MAG: site-specific DNA-methyltransferase [Acidaminococcaceae bacterium]|nr:site-specific DNA-methyltransferase [Acidaminococcaceae bacterium]
MCFFTVFDLLVSQAKRKGISMDEMYAFFHQQKIKKAQIEELQNSAYIPGDLKDSILSFLDMTELEATLALGRIPGKYQNSFFENISRIASLLSPDESEGISKVDPYYENEYGKLYKDDCIKVLRTLSDNCVDMVFADPPFNLKKTYDPGVEDSLTTSNYLNWTYQWVDECARILKPGGRIFIYNIPKWCVYIAGHLCEQLTFWDWIAVDMKFSLPIQSRLYPAHYGLISFVKGAKASTFNNQRIPMQVCRHCGGELKDYGGYKAKMNPAGVNVSDVWSDIYPVRHKNSKNRKYNELSVKLLDRIISMSTNPGDVVFDPFGGSGTTYAVAQILKRRWLGTELGDCEIIKQRLLHPEKDLVHLQKVYEEKDHLFTDDTLALRRKNGFWTCDSVREGSVEKPVDGQLSLNIYFSDNIMKKS